MIRKWVSGFRTRPVQTLLALIVIVAGAMTAVCWLSAATIPDLSRYAYGDRGDATQPVPDWFNAVQQQLPAALYADIWLTVGYGLVLGGSAWIFRLWATPRVRVHRSRKATPWQA